MDLKGGNRMIRKKIRSVYSTEKNPDGYTQVAFYTKKGDKRPDISCLLGSEEVQITSHEPSWGSVPIRGRDRLKTLRDGLIEICKELGIE